jgi:hypothetical protein
VTAGRYTAVFTGTFALKRPGEYLYLVMDADRVLGCGAVLRRGRPPREMLAREVHFAELPERCRRLVLDTYRRLWDL